MKSNFEITEVISALVEAHPKVFKGCTPEFSLSVPPGWGKLIDELCALLDLRCSEKQLQDIEIGKIGLESGALDVEIYCACELSEDLVEVIKAKLFALGTRSLFSCCICGVLVKGSQEAGATVLCKKHKKVKGQGGLQT